jgi:uncharacterized membrane protein
MGKGRLEAFSDGVLAIIITIMVLELRPPHEPTLAALGESLPVFFSYILSFVFVGIYWNNHHHLLHACHKVNGRAMWANLHLLFWLSLTPFVTAWMGEASFAPLTVTMYGVVLWMSGFAFSILANALRAQEGKDSAIDRALGRDRKGLASVVLYTVAIAVSFFSAGLAFAIYVVVAVLWFIPDPRFERVLAR